MIFNLGALATMSMKAVILAAGQGTRMRSELPKVLHRLAGKALLAWVVDEAQNLSLDDIIVVYGHKGEQVRTAMEPYHLTWIEQKEQKGTGHAVQQTEAFWDGCDQLLVLLGDTPLITADTLQRLIKTTRKNELGIVTHMAEEPTGLGRILRDKNHQIIGIVEEKDANEEQKAINEINTGIMLLPVEKLRTWLPKLKSNNAQKELYITDIFAMAVADNVPIKSVHPLFSEEIYGINTRRQLAQLERFYQQFVAETLMDEGVSLADPARFDLRGDLEIDPDVTIDVNVIIEGHCKIARGCQIGANVILKNVTLAENVTILPNSILDETTVAANCTIGPFARLRPGTQLAEGVKIGNFVETKKAIVGKGSKLPHLSYIGDADIGANVNIGAGTITCNYDGVHKNKTIIKDDAFIGSDTQLVAPVIIEKGAYIGAGSTITKTAPEGKLTLSRVRQTTIEQWQPPKKDR